MRVVLGGVVIGLALVGCGESGLRENQSPINPLSGGPYPGDETDTGVDEDDDGQIVDEETGVRTNPWVSASDEATSTFSVDVDSGSYTLARRDLNNGTLPDPATVRVEEFINYFDYDLARPLPQTLPFQVTLDAAPSAFPPVDADPGRVDLLQIGIQAEEIDERLRDPVNLVFLLDVSGSMNTPSKLGLVIFAMKQLVDKLGPDDTLGIVVYAGADGVVLEPTAVENKSAILDALDALTAGGSTNGEAGIRTAYELAKRAYRDDGVNRVVLCTDGDFNVGITGDALIDEVASWKDQGIFLTTLGFGSSFGQDDFMEQLANNSNGNYGFIDSPNEATHMLGDKLVSTLQVVAKDTKVQVAFDAEQVKRWRLVGYENRVLDNDEFDDDTVDAGDIGAGHNVVALYEIERTGTVTDAPLAEVRLRYKEPTASESTEHIWTLRERDRSVSFDAAPADLQWAAGVAEFAEILRGSPHVDDADLGRVRSLLLEAPVKDGLDPSQLELLDLVERAAALE